MDLTRGLLTQVNEHNKIELATIMSKTNNQFRFKGKISKSNVKQDSRFVDSCGLKFTHRTLMEIWNENYSFSTKWIHLRWPNTVFARAFADAIQPAHKDCKNKQAVNRAIILFTQIHTICAIFLYYWTQCIDGFSLLLQRYVRKGNDAKNPAILCFFFVTEITQLRATHAQLFEKLRPIVFTETCRFLTIQSLEFQDIWHKNSSETMWMIYRKKIWILT